MPMVLLNGKMAESWREPLAVAAGHDFEFRSVADGLSDPHLLREAQALISPSFDGSLPAMEALRLIQVPLIGTDRIVLRDLPRKVTVCNVDGHETAVAEYVIMVILMSARNIVEITATFRAGSWHYGSHVSGPPAAEISGATVAVVGFGRIGRAVARRANALGMNVLVCSRTFSKDHAVSAYYPLNEIKKCIARADYIVIAVKLTDDTRGLIGKDELSAASRTVVLVNVARGECVDEGALYAACSEGRIRGAVIDTWYRYPSVADPSPPPSQFRFDHLANVVMTPHISAWTNGTIERRQSQVVQNLRNLRDGLPLERVVAANIDHSRREMQ